MMSYAKSLTRRVKEAARAAGADVLAVDIDDDGNRVLIWID